MTILTASSSERILRLDLHPTLRAWREPNINVLPKSKKARALLTLVALSEGKLITRVRAASMLWSNLERATGLARLRNTLHYLQRELAEFELEPFRVDDQTIALRPDAFILETERGSLDDVKEPGAEQSFLVELERIDPAFDHWLTRIRDERSARHPLFEAAKAISEGAGLHQRYDDRPTIAVTKIENVDPALEEQFARALTEEVGSALARMRWFRTITRGARGHPLSTGSGDISNIADYLLVGTLHYDDHRYRLLLKLLDLTNSGILVWVESFEEPTAVASSIQRKLANVVAARLDTDLLIIEAERRRRLPLQKNDGYALVLRAVPAIYRLDRGSFLGAGHALEEAVAADRECALAYSWLAYWHMFLVGQGWATNPFQSMEQAGKAAERAMMLDRRDARAMTIAGHVKAFLGGLLDEAAALHELAIQTNPALALAWHFYSVTHAYAGRLDDAFQCISHCLDLAPGNPHGFYAEGALGIIQLLRGEYLAAADIGRRVTERHPQFSSAYKSYLAALGHLGRKAEAAAALQRLRALEPKFSLQRFRASARYRCAENLECFMTGLRLAGLT